MKTVIYFTAGQLATGPEQTAIDAITAVPGFNVKVRSALGANYTGGIPEQADFVAGTRPSAYANTTTYPEFNPASPPAQDVGATQKVLSSGVKFTGPAITGTYVNGYTPTIVNGVVTGLVAS